MTILIKNGLIIDGTGTPGYNSDILIEDDKIVKIDESIKANKDMKIIDASGRIVAPGFIDIHNHADFNILDANRAESFVMQGLTTLLVSVCGTGISPTSEIIERYYTDLMGKALCVDAKLFNNFQEAFEVIEKKGVGLNLAFLIPQGNVRASIMGMESRPATEDEIQKMKEIVEENMKVGAFGLSTGLVYPPGSITPTSELIELSKVVSKYNGIYDSHMRNEGDGIIDIGMSELIEIAREANVRAHISHWSVISRYAYEELTQKAIELMEQARAEGLQITADLVPYDDGVTSLPFVLMETWVFDNFQENITDQETRKRIKKEISDRIFSMFLSDAPFYIKLIPKFLLKKLVYKALSKQVSIIYCLNNPEFEGHTLNEALKVLYPSKGIEESLLDFVRDQEGSIIIRHQLKNEEKSVIPLFKRPYVSASSDSILIVGRNNHPRVYGAFPRIIERWVRELGIFNLEDVIQKMTSLPALTLGLMDRGVLKEGKIADIVIFDYENIEEKGTIENGCQHPEGIDYVIINGKIAVSEGIQSENLYGRVLRHQS
jgi:N-acyl-D-amino-acid deacylase